MKLCNDTITVFNAHFDETAGDDIYHPTAIAGVRWYMTQAETVDPKGGLVMANRITIRIPTNARAAGLYVDPIAYRLADDVTGLWTLEGGTVIIKGTIPTQGEQTPANLTPDEATPEEPNEVAGDGSGGDNGEGTEEPAQTTRSATAWTPKLLHETFPECMTVLGVTDNRRAPNGKHWRVTAT